MVPATNLLLVNRAKYPYSIVGHAAIIYSNQTSSITSNDRGRKAAKEGRLYIYNSTTRTTLKKAAYYADVYSNTIFTEAHVTTVSTT